MKKHLLFLLLTLVLSKVTAQNKTDDLDLKTSLISPEKIINISEGHYLIDFGKAFFGTVEITSKRAQNDSLICHLGEKLETINTIDKKPEGTIRYQKVVLQNLTANKPTTLQLKPDKRNTGPAAIKLPEHIGVIMPFRYLEIENLKIPIEALNISQKAVHYKFNDDASYFSSSNKIMDSIWQLCKHTIKATSFMGYYVDGDRERIPYEADAYINQLSHYSVDNEYTMARRTNAYFIENPTWPTEWLLHTVLMFYTDYMYTGDVAPLKEHYENLKLKTLMDLERTDGLISSKSPNLNEDLILRLGFKKADTKIKDIIDWPPAQKDTGWKLATAEGERDGYDIVPVNTVVNAFYYYNLKLMAEIATTINKPEDAIFFRNKANKVKKAINTKLFNHSKGYYLDGENSTHSSLHANMLPLAFDLVPKEHIKTVTEFVKSRGMACSVYGAQYLLEGLYKHHEEKYASALITDTIGDRNWWNMIKVGATMTMEAWDMKYKPNSDWNHAWGTAPLNAITRYMWGIKPKTPGFAVAEINPKLGDLVSSKIKVPTQHGFIYAEHQKENNKTTFKITIPEGMTAEFLHPKTASKVTLNMKKVKKKSASLMLESGLHVIEVFL
ncbi:alpha-L-rhamnosidase C-terminal domain-containing protein [Mariniflexile gromovii]|uniref:alpha-L-rhamnosidase n=1 Tax=Mariniflexile gromovii TaxID=362523 RepID=A0ABS4BTS0_9FLAO|nr:trehalase family glycosidase [Mariniflexile gromovii]MBP0903984.1 family 78 glycoside hydrolase catalytic domain [Mariniflexile gromovii]